MQALLFYARSPALNASAMCERVPWRGGMKSVFLGKGLILASLIAQRVPAQECEGTEAIQSGHF